MKTSRQRLLDYVQSHRMVTAIEISQAMKMTPANARHHLGILIEEGLVEIAGHLPQSAKGRPAQLYRLSEKSVGDNLDNLARALLEELLGYLPVEAQAAVYQHVAERLAAVPGLAGSTLPGEELSAKSAASLTQRLYGAIQRLNEQHYQARWEARADAPRITLAHCPYAAILPHYPHICLLDRFLLEALVGAPVKQTARLASDQRGGTYCMFAVGKH